MVTTRQESAWAALTEAAAMHGPPAYFTTDRVAARASVQALAALQPDLLVTRHGAPARGPGMRRALDRLAYAFDAVTVPDHGRYLPA